MFHARILLIRSPSLVAASALTFSGIAPGNAQIPERTDASAGLAASSIGKFTEASAPVELISPRIRAQPVEAATHTIPFEAVRAFFSGSTVLDSGQLDVAPYIFANVEGLLASAGRDVYVRGTQAPAGTVFDIVHVGEPLVDPDDGDVLGYEGIHVGRGRVRRAGDPATVTLTQSSREALIGDYLLSAERVAPVDFLTRVPGTSIDGRIISVVDGVDLIGQYQVVVLNRGARHGLEPGHVLRAYKTGRVVSDTANRGRFAEKVRLPDEPAGSMMVFRVYDRMSHALILEATSAISVLDTVRNP